MKNDRYFFLLLTFYILFILLSVFFQYQPGMAVFTNFIGFSKQLLALVPMTFVLIGLFEVWVKKETVEKHLGHSAGFRGYLWCVILAGTTLGGLYTALPVAHALYKKGAGYNKIFFYLGAATVCRIPMTLFEISFLGIEFTLIRWAITLPLFWITAEVMGKIALGKKIKVFRD